MEIVVCECGQKTQVPEELGNRTMHCSRCSRELIAPGQEIPDSTPQTKADKKKKLKQNTRENDSGKSHWNSPGIEKRPTARSWNILVLIMIAILLIGIAATAYVMFNSNDDNEDDAPDNDSSKIELRGEKADGILANKQVGA